MDQNIWNNRSKFQIEDIRWIRVMIALRLGLVDTIEGQTDFDLKDRHFRMKVSTISI
jgi:hypothetical protein